MFNAYIHGSVRAVVLDSIYNIPSSLSLAPSEGRENEGLGTGSYLFKGIYCMHCIICSSAAPPREQFLATKSR